MNDAIRSPAYLSADHKPQAMNLPYRHISLLTLSITLAFSVTAQDKLDDGTLLTWNQEISVGMDSLRNDSAMLPAYTTNVYETRASRMEDLLTKALPAAKFKKTGDVLRADNVLFPAGASAPVTLLVRSTDDKRSGKTMLLLSVLQNGAPVAHTPALENAVHDLGVRLNKAVVQQQIDDQKKKLAKTADKTESAVKDQDKAQGKLNKAQAEMKKIAKTKLDLQNEHNILEKDIALQNERWTTSQDPKDLKKLTKARDKISKNESKLADTLKDETKTQADIAKYTAQVPDAAKARDAKAATQADVQRTVDSLQRKLESIK